MITISKKPSINVLCAAIASAFALSACGGGGGGTEGTSPSSGSGYAPVNVSIKAPANEVNNAGASSEVLVAGAASTPNTKLASLVWTAQPSGATLKNADCATAVKNSVTYTTNQQNATGNSQWACAVGISAPLTLDKATAYTLTLTATDEKGNTKSTTQAVNFNPVPGGTGGVPGGLAASAGNNFTSAAGVLNQLHCSATGGTAPYSYQWVVTDNGGYNINLSSYAAADTSFTTPAGEGVLGFTCRATDAASSVVTSRVNVTVSAPAPATTSFVAGIAKLSSATPGATITLDGSTTGWFDAAGKATTGAVASYQWTSTDPTVVISNPTAATTSAYIPATNAGMRTIGFTLAAKAGAQESSASANVLVDPFGPLSLKIAPSATAATAGTSVSIVATATSPTGSPQLYYQWTQISGPAIELGGASTSSLGIVPPLNSLGANYVFRVAVGYQPITGATPGLYFADAVVTVTK